MSAEAPHRKHRTWEEGYADLVTFYEKHGHSSPLGKADANGRWAAEQRYKRKRGELTEKQIQLLDNVHYDWASWEERLEAQWQRMFGLLKGYRLKFGHTRVPQKEIYAKEKLGNWVTNQQSNYRNKKLKDSRKALLEAIGFEWLRDESLLWKATRPLGKSDDNWDEKFSVLRQYKDEHGDALVPSQHMARMENGDAFSLGAFVSRQRLLKRDGRLRGEREEMLQSIGFAFTIDFYDANASTQQKSWNDMFHRLCQYKKIHGNVDISVQDSDDHELGMWARHQRTLHVARGELAPIRFQRLDDLGFTWRPFEERWDAMVDHLQTYKREHGDCKVPHSYQTCDGDNLGSWVYTVRGIRNGTRKDRKLGPEKIAELDALGFFWDKMTDYNWDIMYEALKHYYATHGNCRVPHSYKGDSDLPTSLGGWASKQRRYLEKKLENTGNTMYVERRKKLNALSFEWDYLVEANWEAMFAGLEQYKAENGGCCVPYCYEIESNGLPRKLGNWVYTQRAGLLAKVEDGNDVAIERKRRLDEIGFVWDLSHTNWMKMYEKLQEYHSAHGNCRVPSNYNLDYEGLPSKLCNWVSFQKQSVPRKAETGDPEHVERKKLLDNLHFEYDNVYAAKWEDTFERLKKFHALEGNCRVPTGYDDGSSGPCLEGWARLQRRVLDKATAGDPKYVERKRLLDTLSFEYDKADEAKWMAMFDVLKKFVEEHGHCNVPYSYGADEKGDISPALGHWCYEQRKTVPAKLGNINTIQDFKERKRLLDSIHFEWEVESENEKKWNASFEQLKSFKEIHGHCRVPTILSNNEDTTYLYNWVRNQQAKVLSNADSGDIFLERMRRLDSIGFEWKRTFDYKWEKMFDSLVEYKNKHGNCRVPYRGNNAVNGPTGQLGIWVYQQRTAVPPKAIEGDPVYIERKGRLDSIGFEWIDVHSSKWEVMFAGLERFHRKHGHSRVKRQYKDTDQPLPANLGAWLSIQRSKIPETIEQGNKVAADRKQRLDSLGFLWQTRAPPKQYTRNGKVIKARKSSNVVLDREEGRNQRRGSAASKSVDYNAEKDAGFIVDEKDDDDPCCMCRKGGELMICDGGDLHDIEGCGRSFHVECVERDAVPPGDWVCEVCAIEHGMESVGVRGYEYPDFGPDTDAVAAGDNDGGNGGGGTNKRVLDDDDVAPDQMKKRKVEENDAGDDDIKPPEPKRRMVIIYDSSDDE